MAEHKRTMNCGCILALDYDKTLAVFYCPLHKAAPKLYESLEECLLLIDDLMPGVANIALQNYERLNMAPINARKAIAEAKAIMTHNVKGKEMEIKVTHQISDERVEDLLCDALEGGSNYWYVINSCNYPEGETKESLGIEFPHTQLPLKGGSLTIGDCLIDGTDKILDREAIRKGLNVMADKYPSHYADFIDGNDDALTGDVFLQCAVFGKLVYG